MATEKIVDQLKALKTAWPIFVFVGTLLLNHLKTQSDFEYTVREMKYTFEEEIIKLRDKDEVIVRDNDRVDHKVDKLEEMVVKYYKRKPDVD